MGALGFFADLAGFGPGVFFEGLASFGMDDVQEATETFERVEPGLLIRSQSTGTSFDGELAHDSVIMV